MLSNIDRCYYQIPGVYAILANGYGKIYIGSAMDLYKRANQHINHLKQNKHFNRYLQRFYNKYGPQSLEIQPLKIFGKSITNKKIREYEQIYVDMFYDNNKSCFNLSSNTICLPASKGGLLSQKRKMMQYWKDNKERLLPAVMKNLKKARAAQREMAKAGIKRKSWNKGKNASPEAIGKMRASAIKRGRIKNTLKPVNMYDKRWNFIKAFECITDAAMELSGNYKLASNIGAVCRKKRPTAFGHYWAFA